MDFSFNDQSDKTYFSDLFIWAIILPIIFFQYIVKDFVLRCFQICFSRSILSFLSFPQLKITDFVKRSNCLWAIFYSTSGTGSCFKLVIYDWFYSQLLQCWASGFHKDSYIVTDSSKLSLRALCDLWEICCEIGTAETQ